MDIKDTKAERKTGMELEVPMVIDNTGSPSTRETTQQLFDGLHKKYGYDFDKDVTTNEILGLKGVTYGDVGLDNPVSTLEIGFFASPDLHRLSEQFIQAIRELNSVHSEIRFLSLSRQPVMGDDAETYKEYVSKKGIYPVIVERGWDHRRGVSTASTQPSVDVSVEEAIDAVNTLQALSGVYTALFANSPLYKGEKTGNMESRALMWRDFMATSRASNDRKMIDIPKEPSTGWADYLYRVWNHPPVFLPEESGKGYKKALCLIPDNSEMTMLEFLKSQEKKPFHMFNGEDFDTEVSLSPSGFYADKAFWWAFWVARIRSELDPSIDIQKLVSAVHQKDEEQIQEMLKKNLKKMYIEVRDIGTTADPLASCALILGIIENLEEAKQFVSRHPWSFWIDLREQAIKEGMAAVKDISPEVLQIAEKGLEKRGLGEEKFIEPLLDRTQSPAEHVLSQFDEGGIEKVTKENQF